MLDEKESLVTLVARVCLCLECMVSVFTKSGSGTFFSHTAWFSLSSFRSL